MTDPAQLLKSIYLGDRACKKLFLDGWKRRFCMQVDCISYLKKGKETWNFYNDENLIDGWIEFTDVAAISFSPDGVIPNDLIHEISVEILDGGHVFQAYVAGGTGKGETTEVVIKIQAKGISIKTHQEFLAEYF